LESEAGMAARVVTLAFEGVEARRVEVEAQLSSGEFAFIVVGLGDKAVAESRERVRAAFTGLGLAMPGKRIIVNLAPADLPKVGSHYDLPIALAVMAAMGIVPPDALGDWAAMGEAAWAGETRILAAPSLIALVNHFRGTQILSPPKPGPMRDGEHGPDLREVKGQENAKRALEIAAAGGHNLAFVGPPGSGKSMMAARLPGLLPPLTPEELLETSMIHSVAGLIAKGELTRARPFRSPHHSASMAALTGGGLKAKPGEVSLAHNGVLFLDELPEFSGIR
jgi:magnesium chelatase family protein